MGKKLTRLWCSMWGHRTKTSYVNGTLVQIEVIKCRCLHKFSAVARYDA